MGQPRTVGVRELKARASDIIREMQLNGVEYVVTLRGRPVARLEPLGFEERTAGIDGMGNMRGALMDLPHVDWDDFVEAKNLWNPREMNDDD